MNVSTLDNRYMEFRLGHQLFAIPLMSVKEVVQKPEITSVPNMPSHFEGMMNLRGQVLGVFNVRKKLAAQKKLETTHTPDVVVVIEAEGLSVGMIVDEVTRVHHASEDTLKQAPLKQDDPAAVYIKSVIQAENDMVLTIDVSKLLEIEKYKQKVAA